MGSKRKARVAQEIQTSHVIAKTQNHDKLFKIRARLVQEIQPFHGLGKTRKIKETEHLSA